MSVIILTRKKAVGYIRVSTDEQVKDGISLDNQAECITAYCKAKSWDLVQLITDEGKSAKDLNRKGVKKLIASAKNKEFDVLVIYRLDRLTRCVRDLGYLVQDVFDKNGVAFSSIQESFDTSNATGKLILNVLGSIAQWERETIIERTRDGLRYKKAKLECYGPVPFGFELNGKKLLPNEQELVTVSRIIRLRHKLKYSYRKIANMLNADGFRTRTGREWFASSIQIIANNEIYSKLEAS
jgi:site-specific DNA recombinase